MNEIEIDSVSKRFENHLKVEQNYRIILSGKFGVGKTFFLKKFFEARKDQYNPVFIYPVNYVVSSNEDIFELIKVDITKQLFTTRKFKKSNSVSVAKRVALFASEKPHHFLKFITSSFKKINPFVEIADDIYDGLSKLYSEYKDYEKDLEDKFKISEDKLEEFADSFNDKVGNFFEEDFITKILKEKLNEIKKGGKKKNVLVIDDLDRIDPEHVFRLLNILSAHNNDIGSKNKFDFEHVIIVCDKENIENIFYHKYGNNVDFEGYIDKFYSTDIFLYKNEEAVKFYLKTIFNTKNTPSGLLDLIFLILSTLVEHENLSVRKIIKHSYNVEIERVLLFEQAGLQEKNTSIIQGGANFIKEWDRFNIDSYDLQILKIFRLMSIIYGDFNDFFDHLENLTNITNTQDANDLNHILSFLALQTHIAGKTGDKLFFQPFYEKNYRDQQVLTNLEQPQLTFLSAHYNIKLRWNHLNQYLGQESYFVDAQAINSDRHQYLGDRPAKTIALSEIFKAIKNIIISCQNKGYLYKAGIVLTMKGTT